MKKIPSLFKRDYEGTRQVYDEVVPGCEWVLAGEGAATIKYDGTACMVRAGQLFKRFDRKRGKDAPPDWEPCEAAPDEQTGHWPGWVPVDPANPADRWYASVSFIPNKDGTYELVGPKVQGNPYGLGEHELWEHGEVYQLDDPPVDSPRTFVAIREWLKTAGIEGIVWHHTDGRMAKIKRRDFGYEWPVLPRTGA